MYGGKLIIFSGAGISKPSGIPTFEDMGQDVRSKLSRDYFRKHPKEFYEILKMMHDTCAKAEPNAAHIAIAEYEVPVITMNIDGLHVRAGTKDIVEIHGHTRELFCRECGKVYPFEEVEDFFCCGKALEHHTVLYGDIIPKYPEAFQMIDNATHMLVVGTSFYTSTSSEIVNYAQKKGVKVAVVNDKAEEVVPILVKSFCMDCDDRVFNMYKIPKLRNAEFIWGR